MAKAQSDKPPVFERIFNERWNADDQTLTRSIVTLNEVRLAIEAHNQEFPDEYLSPGNAANFVKDVIRNRRSANRNWPPSILAHGFTVRQVTGENNCFEFIRLAPGQTEPFPDLIVPADDTRRHRIESVSLPLTSRRLGRKDESWLIQVLVRLRVLETHFSLHSEHHIVQLDHLQMSLKLRRTEIDSLFLAIADRNPELPGRRRRRRVKDPADYYEIIVTCEAKGRRDDILLHQVRNQVQAVFGQPAITQNLVIPVAVKAFGRSEVFVAEFDAVSRDDALSISDENDLTLRQSSDL